MTVTLKGEQCQAFVRLFSVLAESLERRTLLSTVNLDTDTGSNSIYIRNSGGTEQIFQNQPLTSTPTISFPASDNNEIDISDGNGNNTITLDYSGGDPIPGSVVIQPKGNNTYNTETADTVDIVNTENGANLVLSQAGPLANKVIQISPNGSGFDDQVSIVASEVQPNLNLIDPGSPGNQITVNSGTFIFNSDLGIGSASTSVTVNSGGTPTNKATAWFAVTQHLASLDVESGGMVSMIAAGQQVLDTGTLVVAGKLDLQDNDLIVNNPGTSLSTLEGEITLGDQNDLNDHALPAGSIGSSVAFNDGMFVGFAPESVINLDTLDGQAIATGALVARYTWQADFLMRGYMDGGDLILIELNATSRTGNTSNLWYQGDANLDGIIGDADESIYSTDFQLSAPFSPPTTVNVGDRYSVALPDQTPGPDETPIVRWDINWGDGDVDSYDPNSSSHAAHAYTAAQPIQIQMSALLDDGTSYQPAAIPLAIVPYGTYITVNQAAASPGANFIVADNSLGKTIIMEDGLQVAGPFTTSSILTLAITGDTSGSLTVNFSNGNPLPISGIQTDSHHIYVTGGNQLLSTATAAIFGNVFSGVTNALLRTFSSEIRYPSTSQLTYENSSAGDTLIALDGTVTLAGDPEDQAQALDTGPTVYVNTGATVLFTGTQSLSSLSILPGGTARMTTDGTAVLITDALDLSDPTDSFAGGLLDLANNDLIVRQGDLSAVAGWIASGYDGGLWDNNPSVSPPTAGIVSSTAAEDQYGLEGLGYAQIGPEYYYPETGMVPLTTFDNQPVSDGDVVVKFTYYGDANLDGTVDGADSALVNLDYTGDTGWGQGDFYYEGQVGSDDQTAITDAEAIEYSPGLLPATLNLEADQELAATSLPGYLPNGTTPIHSWQVNWGNGVVDTLTVTGPGSYFQNPYHDVPGTYLASFTALDSNGDPIYRYPHVTINIALPDLPAYSQPSSNPGLPSGAQPFSPPVGVGYSAYGTDLPAIAANNLDGQPDDTLTFTGANFTDSSNPFSDTQFLVYGQTDSADGTLADAAIQDPTTNGVLATLPASEPGGSMYFVWPVSSAGVGSPVAINQTDAQWMEPTSAAPGAYVAVYGRNLDNSSGDSWIYLQPANGSVGPWIPILAATYQAETTEFHDSANPYQLQFHLPASLAAGTYQVWVNNGTGGKYGWSEEPTALTVAQAPSIPDHVINITYDPSITDYGPTITQDLSTLSNNYGGGTLYFAPGTYDVNNDAVQRISIEYAASGTYELAYGYGASAVTSGNLNYSGNSLTNANTIQCALNRIMLQVDPSGAEQAMVEDDFYRYTVRFNFTNTLPIYFADLNLVPQSGQSLQVYVAGTDQILVPNNVRIEGAGENSSTIEFDGNVPIEQDVTQLNLFDGNFDIGTLDGAGRNVDFESIGLTYNGPNETYAASEGTTFELVRERGAVNVTFNDVALVSQDSWAFDWSSTPTSNTSNVTLTNSTIIGAETFLVGTKNVLFDHDTFLQAYIFNTAGITVIGGENFAMTNCTTENEEDYLGDPPDVPQAQYLYGFGKFIEFEYQVSNVYFAGNTSVKLGEGPSMLEDRNNTGEQVLVDTETTPSLAQIISATPTKITVMGDQRGSIILNDGYTTYIDITAGPGLGEHAEVDPAVPAFYNSSNDQTTITISGQFNVVPTAGYANINQEPINLVFYQNTINRSTGLNTALDLASTGIDINAGYGLVIDGNTINNTTVGIKLYSQVEDSSIGTVPNTVEFADVVNNILNVPLAANSIHPVGIYFETQLTPHPEIIGSEILRNDSSYVGVNVANNTISQTSVSYGSAGDAIAIGLPGYGEFGFADSNSFNNPGGPETLVVLQRNIVNGFQVGLVAATDPDCLLYKNTFNAGPSGSSAIDFTNGYNAGPSLLLQGNSYVGYSGSEYSGSVPSPTLAVTQGPIYLTSDGSANVVIPLLLQNSGAGDLTWTAIAATPGGSWLSVENNTGTISPESSAATGLLVAHPAGLAPGSYWMTFYILYDGSVQYQIAVNLTVL